MTAPVDFNYRCSRAMTAVRLIGENVRLIRNASTMPFNMLSTLALNIKASDSLDIAPLVNGGTQAQVDTAVGRFVGGWTNPHVNLTAVRNSLPALFTALQSLKNTIGDPVTWNPQDGEVWVTVTGPQLTTLHASLDGILTALAPLE